VLVVCAVVWSGSDAARRPHALGGTLSQKKVLSIVTLCGKYTKNKKQKNHAAGRPHALGGTLSQKVSSIVTFLVNTPGHSLLCQDYTDFKLKKY
jgi:hypothetical protein